MNITFSVDEQMLRRARAAARAMGKSRNQALREHLKRLAGRAQLEAEIESFLASTARRPGRLQGWRFDRDEANQRR